MRREVRRMLCKDHQRRSVSRSFSARPPAVSVQNHRRSWDWLSFLVARRCHISRRSAQPSVGDRKCVKGSLKKTPNLSPLPTNRSLTVNSCLQTIVRLKIFCTYQPFHPACSPFSGRFWDLEVKNGIKTLQKPKLSRVLIKCYGKSYALAGVFVFSLVRSKALFSDNKQVCCKSVALQYVTCPLYLPCRKGGDQSDPATYPVENNPVLWNLRPQRPAKSCHCVLLRRRPVFVRLRADHPPAPLLLPCPENGHEDEGGHLSHHLPEGRWTVAHPSAATQHVLHWLCNFS